MYQDILDGKKEFVLNPSVVFKDMDGTLACYVPEAGKYYKFTDQERKIIQLYLDCESDIKKFLSEIKKDKELFKKTEDFFREMEETGIIIVVSKE